MLIKNNFRRYIYILAELISGPLYLKSRPEAIEYRLLKSEIIKDFEQSDESFLNEPLEYIYMNIYEMEPPLELFGRFNNCFYWVSEVYIRLFFKYKKSFSYLFLILPLKKCIEMFEIYHQMDFSQTYKEFEKYMEQYKILPMLIKKNNLTMKKLAKLTNINYNSIDAYCRSDLKLFGASFENIISLSKALDVNINIFLNKLNLEIK